MAFWKPGTVAPGSNQLKSALDRENDKEGAVIAHANVKGLTLQQQRVRLPIFSYRNFFATNLQGDHILYLVEKYQVTIIVGETGCGKTTRKCKLV